MLSIVLVFCIPKNYNIYVVLTNILSGVSFVKWINSSPCVPPSPAVFLLAVSAGAVAAGWGCGWLCVTLPRRGAAAAGRFQNWDDEALCHFPLPQEKVRRDVTSDEEQLIINHEYR